jgi:hypothetical protein
MDTRPFRAVSLVEVTLGKFLPFADKKRFTRDLILTLVLLAIASGLYFQRNQFSTLNSRKPGMSQAAAAKNDSPHEIDLTFTRRSPLSGRSDLAGRMRLDDDSSGPDYDLSKCSFKAYVPQADPKEPYGILVYLGYKDSVSVPQAWEPTLDQNHLIFITPVCHSGKNFAPSVPAWQMLGLAFDAVENLRQRYTINPRRIYLMAWQDGMQQLFASADIFTGYIIIYDGVYFRPLVLPSGNGYYPAGFEPPYRAMFRTAQQRPIVLIGDSFTDPENAACLVCRSLRADGFSHLQTQVLSLSEDLHYPNFKVDWFKKETLPFLEGVAATTQQMPKDP